MGSLSLLSWVGSELVYGRGYSQSVPCRNKINCMLQAVLNGVGFFRMGSLINLCFESFDEL